MNRIGQSFRSATKRATQYPAVVVDTHGTRASVRLSGNGAVLHNLGVIGGNVEVGEAVQVDYTTPEPTIVAVSKTYATEDDLYRLLKKYQIPIPEVPITEFDKVMLFSRTDPSEYHLYPATRSGILSAQAYAWNYDDGLYGEDMGHSDWAMRLPPIEIVPSLSSWGYETEWYMPMFVFSEGVEGCRLQGLYAGITGCRFENIHFYWNGRKDKGQYPLWNFYLYSADTEGWWPTYLRTNGTSGSGIPEDAWITRFTNCKFTCFGYDYITIGTPEPSEPWEWAYTNVWFAGVEPGERDWLTIFENCDFYAQSSANVEWASGRVWEDHIGRFAGTSNPKMTLEFRNCRINAGHSPIAVDLPDNADDPIAYNHILSSNTRWKGVSSIQNMNHLHDVSLYLDWESDLSAITHVHSSGSSGGYDENAFHLNEAGEY